MQSEDRSTRQKRERDRWDEVIALAISFPVLGGLLFGLLWSQFNRPAQNLALEGVTSSPPIPEARGAAPSVAAAPFGVSPSATIDDTTVAATVSPPAGIVSKNPVQSSSLRPPVVAAPVGPVVAASPSSASANVPSPAPVSFGDVADDFWAAPFIRTLGERGILASQDGNFSPEQPVTRSEFAAMLAKAFAERQTSPAVPAPVATSFSDVPPGAGATTVINQAVGLGFMNGYTDKSFQPNKSIPKLEGLVALVTGLGLPASTVPVNLTQVYEDGSQIPTWAQDKIRQATQAGLVVNYPNVKQLNPSQPLSRAEAAALVYQALVKTGKAQPVSSQFLVAP